MGQDILLQCYCVRDGSTATQALQCTAAGHRLHMVVLALPVSPHLHCVGTGKISSMDVGAR